MALSLITPDSLNLAQDYAGMGFGGTGSANQLDDYEEGTFTVTVTTGVTSPTYTVQAGSYTKIGKVVTFKIHLLLASGTGNASQVQLGGLPFTSANVSLYGGAFFNYNGGFYTSNEITAHVPQNSTTLQFYHTGGSALAGSSMSNVLAQAIVTGFYYTA